jgi:TctA family transporter
VLQIALYAPVSLVVCLVLAALREDDLRTAARVALKNFTILSLVLAAGTALIFAIEWVF